MLAGSRRVTYLSRTLFAAATLHAELLAGNSSAGIIEAATFGTPVLEDIAASLAEMLTIPNIDFSPHAQALMEGLARALQLERRAWDNPYGDGRAAERIADLLVRLLFDATLLEKSQYLPTVWKLALCRLY
jgi:GDP/UDP-N,N'-diacetylbacillosamine 2-epimerase (hydrolysing)